MSASCPVFGLILSFRQQRRRDDVEHLLTDLCDAVLVPRGLLCAPGERTGEFVVTGDGFQVTDADREEIVLWLARQWPPVAYEVSALGDVGSAA